jgi:phosphoenolpyruvate-protein phosphotransferase/dihydroxyacetone kinase phosphotransfer subunit
MVGIIIVSHSRALAEGLLELVKQVASDQVPLAIAAGAGPDNQDFGTNAIEIMEAIQALDNPQGVLVLMDLGSAILSAEMALELLPPDMHERIRFCAAPLVEGAIAAGIQASLGSDLETVCREAMGALEPKREQLGQAAPGQVAPPPAPIPAEPAGQAAEHIRVTLQNQHGLHARPAARFVQLAASFEADIQVRNESKGKGPVSAKSLNALATLGAVQGSEIIISATGSQARQALEALEGLVLANFGEKLVTQPEAAPERVQAPPVEEGDLQAVPVSEGIAIGPLYLYHPPPPPIPDHKITEPEPTWRRLQRGIETTRTGIQERRRRVAGELGEEQAAIFDAHLLILEDPELAERARQLIFEDHQNEAAAWNDAIQEIARSYQDLDDPYLQQRAADVLDVGGQVLYALAGKTAATAIELPQPVILFAPDLTPTQTAQLDMSKVLGLMTVAGGPTSHSAILARSMGIPAVAGADPSIETMPAGTLLALDGFHGVIAIKPDPEKLSRLEKRRQSWLDQRSALLQTSNLPANTLDGRHIEVAANVGNLRDAELGDANGADGVGLLRTEFLFQTGEKPPDEETQRAALAEIAEFLNPRPVIVRTLDVGGDKELPYINLPPEANPFLGVRAIRLSLREPDLFRTQLRAILRAGAKSNMRIMFPMVTNLRELRTARQLLEEEHLALEEKNIPHAWPLQTGIMIEVPGAALTSSVLAAEVDFFSIGTNDLTQYTLAAERGSAALAEFADALHPAVLRLIQLVVEAAHAKGKWVGVCGELAGDPLATAVLVGLGVDELSLNPGGIPRVKAIIRQIDTSDAQKLARQALEAESTPQVRELAQKFLDTVTPA